MHVAALTDAAVRAIQCPDKVVLYFRHQVLKAVESVGLRVGPPLLVRVVCKNVVDWSHDLVHALNRFNVLSITSDVYLNVFDAGIHF